jgi:hypothetical protein
MGPRQATGTAVGRVGHSVKVATKRSDALNRNVLPRGTHMFFSCSHGRGQDRCRSHGCKTPEPNGRDLIREAATWEYCNII